MTGLQAYNGARWTLESVQQSRSRHEYFRPRVAVPALAAGVAVTPAGAQSIEDQATEPAPVEPSSPPQPTFPAADRESRTSHSQPPRPCMVLPAGRGYTEHGWVWMPYGNAYTYVPPDDSARTWRVYHPAVGWSWVVAPRVWGWGPCVLLRLLRLLALCLVRIRLWPLGMRVTAATLVGATAATGTTAAIELRPLHRRALERRPLDQWADGARRGDAAGRLSLRCERSPLPACRDRTSAGPSSLIRISGGRARSAAWRGAGTTTRRDQRDHRWSWRWRSAGGGRRCRSPGRRRRSRPRRQRRISCRRRLPHCGRSPAGASGQPRGRRRISRRRRLRQCGRSPAQRHHPGQPRGWRRVSRRWWLPQRGWSPAGASAGSRGGAADIPLAAATAVRAVARPVPPRRLGVAAGMPCRAGTAVAVAVVWVAAVALVVGRRSRWRRPLADIAKGQF
jgi:hypothetical protein